MAVEAQLCSEYLGFAQDNAMMMMNNDSGFEMGLSNVCLNHQQGEQLVHGDQIFVGMGRDPVHVCSSSSSSSCSASGSRCLSMPFDQYLAALNERQMRDTDFYLQIQNEKLKYAVEQHRRQQLFLLLKYLDSKAIPIMKKKDHDLAIQKTKSQQLETLVRKAEAETVAWQRVAKETESAIVELTHLLEQAKDPIFMRNSAFNGGKRQECDEESVCECEPRRFEGVEERRMECKGCRRERKSVVFLPCKHLCCCKQCESSLGVCPVCRSVKEAAIQVLV